MTTSLCLMVRNEEAALPGCLQSAADLADEIIVVDTGSTDRTKEIAANFGAKVFDFPWCDDFAAARNECIRHATGEWQRINAVVSSIAGGGARGRRPEFGSRSKQLRK